MSYRLTRQRLVADVRSGDRSPESVCDAQPELRRVAHHHGAEVNEICPICEGEDLVLVTFAFGKGLPSSGRCITNGTELTRLRRRGETTTCYRVEVCRQCWWNHLRESYVLQSEPSVSNSL